MRALVVGGAGFIGSHLVDRLVGEGSPVEVVDDLSTGSLANLAGARGHPDRLLTVHTLDASEPSLADLVARRRPDVVYLLAPSSPADPDEQGAARQALAVTLNVLQVAADIGIAKVVIAVDAEDLHGEVPAREQPVKESWRTEPRTVAAVTSRTIVELLGVHRERMGIEYAVLAIASVYGPRQRTGIVAEVLAAVEAHRATGDDLDEPDVREQHDLVYVDDAVDALVRAASRGSGLVANVGTGEPVSRRELQRRLLAFVSTASATEAEAVVPPPPPARPAPLRRVGRPSRLALSPIRARIHLGWSPFTELGNGLAETVAAAAAGAGGAQAAAK